MGNLNVDLDDLARDMGESLDMVQYAIMAAKSPDIEFDRKPNFSKALVMGIKVGGVAEFVVSSLPENDIDNRERFTALRRDAEKLIKRFWANFSLINVHKSDGGGITLAIPQTPQTVQNAPKGTYTRPATNGRGNKGKNITRLSDATRLEIIKTINTGYGGRCSQKELKEISEAYHCGFSTISRLYYDYRNGK